MVVFKDADPTGQAIKQKDEKQAREQMFAEAGVSQAAVNVVHNRKRFHQGTHKDDCGSDLGPPEEPSIRVALAIEGSFASAISYFYMNKIAYCSDSIDSSEDEFEKVFNNNFSPHCFVGGDGHSRQQDHPNGAVIDTTDLCIYLVRPEMQGSMHVV